MIKTFLRRASRLLGRPESEFASARYWQERYGKGGNSGAGSYGRLATYKARFINELVATRSVCSIIEFGSGDGNQAAMFDFANYTGVDVVAKVVTRCRDRFKDRPGWSFFVTQERHFADRSYDLSMSLDVIYHLVEDDVFEDYMKALFCSADRYVLIFASDHDEREGLHVRSRSYSGWVERNQPNFYVVDTWKHPHALATGLDPNDTSMAFFRLYKRRDAP